MHCSPMDALHWVSKVAERSAQIVSDRTSIRRLDSPAGLLFPRNWYLWWLRKVFCIILCRPCPGRRAHHMKSKWEREVISYYRKQVFWSNLTCDSTVCATPLTLAGHILAEPRSTYALEQRPTTWKSDVLNGSSKTDIIIWPLPYRLHTIFESWQKRYNNGCIMISVSLLQSKTRFSYSM